MSTPPVRVWVVLRPDNTILKGAIRNQSTSATYAATNELNASWPELMKAGYTAHPAQVTVLDDTKDPAPGEWWVCTTPQDIEHYGSISAVPESKRFVAYNNDLSVRPGWERSGNHWRLDQVAPIRKVSLTNG